MWYYVVLWFQTWKLSAASVKCMIVKTCLVVVFICLQVRNHYYPFQQLKSCYEVFDWRPAKQVLLASSTLVLLTIIQKKLCNKPNFKSLYFLSDCEMQSLTFLSQNIYGIIARGGWLVDFATWKVLGDNLPMLIKTSVFLNFQSNKKWDHILSPPLFS